LFVGVTKTYRGTEGCFLPDTVYLKNELHSTLCDGVNYGAIICATNSFEFINLLYFSSASVS